MASCDDLSPSTGTGASLRDRETSDGEARDLGIGSSGEERPPPHFPNLGTGFPPSFASDNPFINGTPSGEVQLRVPRRFEQIGEPVTNSNPNEHNKEIEELRKELSTLSSAVKTSFASITARLENRELGLRRDTSDQRMAPNDRGAGVPGPYPSRSLSGDPRSSTYSDSYNYNGYELRNDTSLFPQRNQNYSNFSARSADVNYGNRSTDYIKVAQYDGKTSWTDYLVQFELAAHANRWDKPTSAIRLACSLRGSAQALLSDLTPEVRYDYDRLVTTLTERFEPENQCEIYKAQMKQRTRKKDEPLPELAQDIKRLTRMAYPSAVINLRDTLSKDCFIEALNDPELELFVCQKEPERLDDAVRIALKYEAFAQSRRKRLMSTKTGIRMQTEDSSYDRISRNEFQEMKAELRELKTSTQAHAGQERRNLYNRGCFNCGDLSHKKINCPHNAQIGNYPRFSDTNRSQNCTGYGQGNRNGRFNGNFNNNQSTESTAKQNRYQQNARQNRFQGNCQQLRPWVRPQL